MEGRVQGRPLGAQTATGSGGALVKLRAKSAPKGAPVNSAMASNLGLFIGLAPIVYCWIFSYLRIAAEYGLALAVASSIALVLLDGRFRSFAALPLLFISIIYLLLSIANMLPAAWTRYWLPEYIFRHWMWAPLLFIFSNSFCTLFTYHRKFIIKNSLILTLTGYLIGRVSIYFSPLGYDLFTNITIYTLIPENASVLFTFAIYVFFKMRKSSSNLLLCLLLIPIFSSAQSLLLFASMIFIKFIGNGRMLVLAVAVSVAFSMVVLPNYPNELYEIDNNTGFRAVIWRDAFEAFIGSNLVGVGFGTEYIKNIFDPFGAVQGFSVANEGEADRMLVGSHNTAFEIGLRMGVPGLIALGAWFTIIVKRSRMTSGKASQMASFVLLLLLINNAVNMGFTTVNFLMCTVLCAGWLLAGAGHAQRPVSISGSPSA